MTILYAILDILFPSRCLACNKRGPEICPNCLSTLREAERESEDWIFPMFDYREPVIKKALHNLKYKNKRRLSKIFAEILYGRILEELADLYLLENFLKPVLIPIPLSKKRYRERGFNQTELICKEILALDKANNSTASNFELNTKLLTKPIETIHQAHIKNRSARLKNLKGSFVVESPAQIKNRNVILIDDITTTGATLSEARKVLKQNGARKIIAFTVAH